MTFGSFFAKSSNFIIVLPYILSQFDVEETNLYLLFITIIGLQILVDLGFTPNFSRIIGYAFAGNDSLEVRESQNQGRPNVHLMQRIVSTMSVAYLALGLLLLTVYSTVGTLFVRNSIDSVSNPESAWLAWFAIIFSTSIFFWGNRYTALLLGIGKVALIKKWEMFFSLLSAFSSILILFFEGTITAIIIMQQFWAIITVLRNYILCKNVEVLRLAHLSNAKIDREVMAMVFNNSWKSAIGVFFSYGAFQFSGIYYANVGTASSSASYLLSLRLLGLVSEFSRAPFYAKIPKLNILWGKKDMLEFKNLARKSTTISLLIFTFVSIASGFLFPYILPLIKSEVVFVSKQFWSIMIIGAFFERYGAMHIQLYSCTNRIIWHISNSITGAIYILLIFVLTSNFGFEGLAWAYFLSYVCFYSWFNATKSYKEFDLKFLVFDRYTLVNLLLLILNFFAIHQYFND